MRGTLHLLGVPIFCYHAMELLQGAATMEGKVVGLRQGFVGELVPLRKSLVGVTKFVAGMISKFVSEGCRV